ncbi:hypothetical protein CRG98_005854 [Punica granatum]|uniref:Uncharacterized protein n=1 Tax=Punica granatum TaxID=22663 RepID=A0A2I0KZK9_PUNGR|nr:hypothetical protein CRG98_005854 [Punica granatum]
MMDKIGASGLLGRDGPLVAGLGQWWRTGPNWIGLTGLGWAAARCLGWTRLLGRAGLPSQTATRLDWKLLGGSSLVRTARTADPGGRRCFGLPKGDQRWSRVALNRRVSVGEGSDTSRRIVAPESEGIPELWAWELSGKNPGELREKRPS